MLRRDYNIPLLFQFFFKLSPNNIPGTQRNIYKTMQGMAIDLSYKNKLKPTDLKLSMPKRDNRAS